MIHDVDQTLLALLRREGLDGSGAEVVFDAPTREWASRRNTPTLDEVRQKIERRYANAMGAAELAQNSVQGRMLEVQQASVQMAGHSRLEQIRASMRGEALPSGGVSGAAAPATPASTPEATPEKPIGQ